MQLNNATGTKRPDQHCEVTAGGMERLWHSTGKKPTYFTGEMPAQDPATQERATKAQTVQRSSNVKGVQVSPAQDILEVSSVPLDLQVLSE